MASTHYTAEVKGRLLLELPPEAEELHLNPGDSIEVEIGLHTAQAAVHDPDPTIALLELWIAQAPTDPEAIREADDDIRELKRNLDLPRKETGARLHFP